MKKLIQYFIKYPITGNILLVLIFVFGGLSLSNLRSTFFPERESRFINIQTVYPGASPEEVEEGIVLKIEDNLKGITGIKEVSSVSQENTGSVTVEIEEGYDVDVMVQEVKNAVDRVSSFPVGIEKPTIYKRENLGVAVTFSLSGDVDLLTLKQYGRQVENDLRGVKGISKVSLSGFPEEEIEISLREDDLRGYQLTFDEVTQAVRRANIEITGGTIKGSEEELLIRARSKNYYADKFRNIIVKTKEDGTTIRLQDIANVVDQWSDSPNRSYLNGEPSVLVTVQNTIDEDILYIAEYVRNYIDEFNEKNQEVEATLVRDFSVTIRQRVDLLLENGVLGAILVLLFLSLFLNYRLAFWVALGIPLSFCGMFIIASIYGVTINIFSLFGMIIVIGILVDDGIVISENIYQHYERGKPPVKAAIDGTLEVIPAVFSAVITTVLAFMIFFFLDGRIGEIVRDLAFVVITTLLFSLIEGFLILPGHISHSKSLKRQSEPSWLEKKTTALMEWQRSKLYAPLFNFALRHKTMTLAIPVGLLIITVGAIQGGIIRTTFFPFVETDNLEVSLTMPAGTPVEITKDWLDHIEEAAWAVNEGFNENRNDSLDVIQFVDKRVGPSTHTGTLSINLLDAETRGTPSFKIINAIREKAGPILGAEKVGYGARGIFGKAVSISLMGNDFEQLNNAKEEIKAELNQLQALKDVNDTQQKGLREINIKLKEKAYNLGLNLQQVLGQVRQGFFGSEVQRLQRGLDEIRVWVRYEEQDRSQIGDLEDMRIRAGDGKEYPLREIATFGIERGVIAINHLNGRREIKIEADMANPTASVTDVMSEVEASIVPPILAKYPSVTVEYGGQSKSSAETTGSAGLIVPLIFLLIFAVISLTFRSMMQAAIVFMTIPFGFIGVAWGHFIHDQAISLLSMYGVLALIGIMINDSLVLVTAMNILLKQGKGFMEALYQAGISRFRPIILTSITTIAGLGPLILETSFQARFLIPMAISVAYGLGVATFLTLIILPVLIASVNQIRRFGVWYWNDVRIAPEKLEPAYQELQADLEEEQA